MILARLALYARRLVLRRRVIARRTVCTLRCTDPIPAWLAQLALVVPRAQRHKRLFTRDALVHPGARHERGKRAGRTVRTADVARRRVAPRAAQPALGYSDLRLRRAVGPGRALHALGLPSIRLVLAEVALSARGALRRIRVLALETAVAVDSWIYSVDRKHDAERREFTSGALCTRSLIPPGAAGAAGGTCSAGCTTSYRCVVAARALKAWIFISGIRKVANIA